MPKQLLHGADVMACMQQMRGERVAQRVRRRWLGHSSCDNGPLECTLEGLIEQMMPADDTAARVRGVMVLRKHPEPAPAVAGARIFALQRMRHCHARLPGLLVGGPHQPRLRRLLAQAGNERVRQHHHPVLVALAGTHYQRAVWEIEVLHAQLQGLGDAQPGAVQQTRQQAMRAAHLRQHRGDLLR